MVKMNIDLRTLPEMIADVAVERLAARGIVLVDARDRGADDRGALNGDIERAFLLDVGRAVTRRYNGTEPVAPSLSDLIGDVREIARAAIQEQLEAAWQDQRPGRRPLWGDRELIAIDHQIVDRIANAVAREVTQRLARELLTKESP
jgi:hypothetical protein